MTGRPPGRRNIRRVDRSVVKKNTRPDTPADPHAHFERLGYKWQARIHSTEVFFAQLPPRILTSNVYAAEWPMYIITPDVLPAEWPILILAAIVMAADCPNNILTLRFRPRSGRSAISFGVNLERP